MADLLTIGEVSRRSGVTASTLRFYQERGLITAERASLGHRRYPRPVLRRIAFLVFAQRIGLTLDEIGAEVAKLPADRAPTRRVWSLLGAGSTSRVEQRIADLERLKLGLTECIGCGCLSLERYSLPIPMTEPPASARVRATGSATDHQVEPRDSWSGTVPTNLSAPPMAGPLHGRQRSKRGKRPAWAVFRPC